MILCGTEQHMAQVVVAEKMPASGIGVGESLLAAESPIVCMAKN